MPYNLPSYESERFSFGPGVLFIGAAGFTPTTDIGAVRTGAALHLTREVLEVPQGSPRTVVKRYATAETATLTVTGIEWNLRNLAYFLGLPYSSSGSLEELDFGGRMTIDEVALKFVHQTPAGETVEALLWRAQGSGDIEVTFGDDLHEMPYSFAAVAATTNWLGEALADGANLCKVRYQRA